MTTERIKEIHQKTAYPKSVSVQQALLQVWNECQEENYHKKYTEKDLRQAFRTGFYKGVSKEIFTEEDLINSITQKD